MTFSGLVTLPNVPPAPLTFDWWDTSSILLVTWDQVLRPGVFDHLNWTIRLNNQTLTPFAAQLQDPTTVLIAANKVAGPPQADECDYAPPPNDIRNMALSPAVPFAGQAVTYHP